MVAANGLPWLYSQSFLINGHDFSCHATLET
jgi:hypothetical protein